MAILKLGVTLKGKSVAALTRAIRADTMAQLEAEAKAAHTLARERVPVLTGNLRGSQAVTRTGETEWTFSEGGPTPESPAGAPYCLVQEFGGANQAGTPHFYSSVEDASKGAGERLHAVARDAVEKALR